MDSILLSTFVLTGIVTTILGPLVPLLTDRWAISNLQAGYLFTAQFMSSLAGVGLSSLLAGRLNFRSLLAAGSAMMGIGVGTIWFLRWPESVAAVCCYGLGLGLIVPTSNILMAEIHRPRPSAALNTLNFAWGLGAVVSSLWIGLLLAEHAVGIGLVGLALVIGAFSLLIAFGIDPFESITENDTVRPQPERTRKWTTLGGVVAIGILFYLYVGTETSVGGWVAAYAKQMEATGHGLWILAPVFFWGALLGGRALAPVALKKISDRALVLIELPVAAVGMTLLVGAHSVDTILVAAAISGIGLAPVFPGVIALLSERFGAATKRHGGWMFGLAAIGGASLPWMVGYITTRSGKFPAGLSIPLAAALAMLVVFAAVSSPRADNRKHPLPTHAGDQI